MRKTKRSDGRQTVVAILLLPEYSQLVLTLLSELLRISGLDGASTFKLVLCSIDGEPVRASNGRSHEVDIAMGHLKGLDAVVVCASYNPMTYADRAILSWLRTTSRHGATLCGVDTGTLILAEAGVLEGKRATLHWDDLHFARSRYPKVEFTSALFERDGRFLTSCGSLGTIDFTLELIAGFAGRDTAEKVLDLTVHGRSERQLAFADPGLAKAVSLMNSNIENPLPMDEIACRLGMSTRSLSRVFHAEFGIPPVRYYSDLRLDYANELVLKTRFSLAEIAFSSGFGSLSWFSRSYKKRFLVAPNAARKHT